MDRLMQKEQVLLQQDQNKTLAHEEAMQIATAAVAVAQEREQTLRSTLEQTETDYQSLQAKYQEQTNRLAAVEEERKQLQLAQNQQQHEHARTSQEREQQWLQQQQQWTSTAAQQEAQRIQKETQLLEQVRQLEEQMELLKEKNEQLLLEQQQEQEKQQKEEEELALKSRTNKEPSRLGLWKRLRRIFSRRKRRDESD
mmetsp:Transcript_5822/g.12113  ORF Transcript_5822/g.12113 Transcript_5822/m.12113 type:complete len:198 (+) Transcript_5822:1-594(+)